eukprot:scaffold2177_cov272-Pinguiococcus_pyrenoidosus.AAC.16
MPRRERRSRMLGSSRRSALLCSQLSLCGVRRWSHGYWRTSRVFCSSTWRQSGCASKSLATLMWES